MLLNVHRQIADLLPEVENNDEAGLPYLMATYKQHKKRYRWLTNAHDCVFSILADVLTVATNALLPYIKEWAVAKQGVLKDF